MSRHLRPLGSFRRRRCGRSAFGAGYAQGDIAASAIGTVSYVDGDKVWAFGHPFEGVGRRSLLLQDAYVYGVIGGGSLEMGGPYKLAAPGHDLGTFSNDAITAIVGRTGPLPATVPVTVLTTDRDTDATRTDGDARRRRGDRRDADRILPALLRRAAGGQRAGSILKGSPARVTGTMCLRVVLEEIPDGVRICNRYVFGGTSAALEFGGLNLVSGFAASDVAEVMALIDGYRFGDLRVTSLSARVELERGAARRSCRSCSCRAASARASA